MGQKLVTVKLATKQHLFCLSRNATKYMLYYSVFYVRWFYTPLRWAGYGEDAAFTRARFLRPASPNLLFANPRENTLGGYDTKTDRQCK